MTRQRTTALTVLIAGIVVAIGAIIWLGARVNGTIASARAVEGDPMAAMFGDVGASALTLLPALLIVLGLAAVAIGYRRFVEPGPDAPVHTYSEQPSFLRQGQGPISG